MFKTAVMEQQTGLPWGLFAGLLAFITLVISAYLLLI